MVGDADRRFVSPDDVETQVFPWGRLQWLNEPRVTGSQRMATGVVTVALGQGHARHNHEGCEEIIYVLEGEGEQTVESDGRAETRPIVAGNLVYLPASAYHATLNTGTVPLRLLVVYDHAGPEADLRAMPECTLEPPHQAAP